MANSQPSTEASSRYDEIVRTVSNYKDPETGETIYVWPTPALEICRRLACAKAVRVFKEDRKASTDITPNGNEYGIMAWSETERYAAMRFIAEACYGPLNKVDPELLRSYHMGQLSDTSVLKGHKLSALRSIVALVIASEMQPGGSLAEGRITAEKPFVLEKQPAWFCEYGDWALEFYESKEFHFTGLHDTFKHWLDTERIPLINSMKRHVKNRRAAEVDAQIAAKEAAKSAKATEHKSADTTAEVREEATIDA